MTKQKASKGLNRRQLARREKEQQVQRTVTWIAIAVVSVIVIVLGYGIVTELFINARRPVARVGDTNITTKAYQSRQRYERARLSTELSQYQRYIEQLDPDNEAAQGLITQLQMTANNIERQLSPEFADLFGNEVLDTMIEEELVRQEAQARGITVDSQAVEVQVELSLGYDRTASQSITSTETLTDTAPPMTAAEYRERYNDFKTFVLDESNFSTAAYRDIIKADMLKERLQEALADGIDTVAEQIEATMFITNTVEAAQGFADRINEGGEAPEDIVAEVEADPSSGTSAFELPWLPVGYISGQLGTEVEKVAFNTPVGRASEPVEGSDGRFYVIYISGHEERELSEDFLADAQEQEYQNWLETQKQERVEYYDWQSAIVTEQ